MDPQILIATANPGKRREILAVMGDLPVRWCTLDDLPPMPETVEDAGTFLANAKKKALHYAGLSGMWTLADDSGLVVDVLGGAPGVHSARFSASGTTPDNNRKLIAALAGVPMEKRTARFVCCAVLARPEEVLASATGLFEGLIIDEPRGKNGFGYDPHFWLPDLGATSAELRPEHKNRISHRGQALRNLLPALRELLDTSRE